MGLAKPDLDQLRARIAALEKRPPLAEGAASAARRKGRAGADNDEQPALAELLAVPAGVLHEVFVDEQRQSGAALGFALGLARGLLQGERQAILYLQLAEQAQELGVPYGTGLRQFGLDPDRLVIGRIGTLTELLWAMEEAIACRSIAAVVADIAGAPRALDFTVSRRLSLRAAAAGTSAFLIRYGREREASAAKLRWRVSPVLSSAGEFDPLAPGPPRFAVKIEKRRLGSRLQRAEGMQLTLEWTENGFVLAESGKRFGAQPRRPAPVSRPEPTLLGDRLSEAG